MKNKFYNQLATLIFAGSVLAVQSCKKLGNNDEQPCGSAEMKLPEIPKGTLFTAPIDPNITKPVIEDTIKLYPGETSSANYKGVGAGGLERDLNAMEVQWTFEHDNILINPETGKYYQKNEVAKMPSFQYIFSKGFTTNLSDDQIQKGDIITSFQGVIKNKCGETNPITAHVKILNSGNVMQPLKELSSIARTGHIQAYHNNKLYLLFGTGGKNNYSYDIKARKLTLLPAIDFDKYGFNADEKKAIERSLYGAQGHGPFTTYAQQGAKIYFSIPLSDHNISQGVVLWEYDLETLQLTKLPSVDRKIYNGMGPANPAVRGSASVAKMTLWDNKIYYFPLYKDLGEAYIGVFDLNTKQWSDEIRVPTDDLVHAIVYVGNPNFEARSYFQLFYALDNQLKLVFEGNREVTYDLDTKALTVKNSDYKHVDIEKYPKSGFVYNGDYYFLANEKLGGVVQDNAFVLYKKNKNGSVEIANFFGGGNRNRGRRFTPVGNTVFVVGQDAVRYWLDK
ncbi:hypothetical protein BCY91_14985 [Pelobium manganitolerans]|uniref:Uncharacterized protein n=1 Tax=Pelobium manganitolerans TaxID=1842495 RepID=A0A419S9T8_9SPHI|nr:hypothetical protein [Pelobium manganitolerans]RKD18638.1 hypothetical protein BCY91_14985 [Pelobium manganitolerans]